MDNLIRIAGGGKSGNPVLPASTVSIELHYQIEFAGSVIALAMLLQIKGFLG